MKTREQYYKEVVDNAIALWNETNTLQGIEKDPVVDLLVKALAYQSYQIQKNIEDYEEKTLRNLRDRIIPYHLIQAMPAFSIIQAKIKSDKNSGIEEMTVAENCNFEFKRNSGKYNFAPLLTTKIIDAELSYSYDDDHNSILCILESPHKIGDLSGLSFYFDTDEIVEVEEIRLRNGTSDHGANPKIPIIKPDQYNELPFTAWFNNNHWFLSENFHLFGTYDYWQDIFLTNTTNIYYIDNHNPNKIHFHNPRHIELEIVLKSHVSAPPPQLKINCIPVVQVEKNEITLDKNHPIQELAGKQNRESEFLNLLCHTGENEMERYANKFMIRQFGVERYNPKILLEQLQEIENRYFSDYYVFQNMGINDFTIDQKNNTTKTLHDIIRETTKKIAEKLKEDGGSEKSNNHYAVLRNEIQENVYIGYLTTSGGWANGIKKEEKAKTDPLLDAKLLIDTQGGRNAITDETQKDDMAKYYFQTKDKLVTIADIRAFCYKELGFQNMEKIDVEKSGNLLNIILMPKNNHKIEEKQLKTLQKKLSLRANHCEFRLEIGNEDIY